MKSYSLISSYSRNMSDKAYYFNMKGFLIFHAKGLFNEFAIHIPRIRMICFSKMNYLNQSHQSSLVFCRFFESAAISMFIRIVVSEGDEVLSSTSINHMNACLLLKSNSIKICMCKECLSKLGKEQYENNNNTKSNRFMTIERFFELFKTALVALDSLLVSNNKSMLEFNMQSNHFFFN